ncbi:hypothetical protein [Antarctobacter sp.]|uniref:hypothetical protein n=1 Tax=Antarctobacter sp. TaxID=1872577 RepID=UPI003A95D0AE
MLDRTVLRGGTTAFFGGQTCGQAAPVDAASTVLKHVFRCPGFRYFRPAQSGQPLAAIGDLGGQHGAGIECQVGPRPFLADAVDPDTRLKPPFKAVIAAPVADETDVQVDPVTHLCQVCGIGGHQRVGLILEDPLQDVMTIIRRGSRPAARAQASPQRDARPLANTSHNKKNAHARRADPGIP